MLGDRLDTDIQGAHAANLPSILVLTGVSSREEAETGPIHPTMIVQDLPALMQLWTPSPPGPLSKPGHGGTGLRGRGGE
jgi:4-nitrophenyl phosphatase